MGDIQIEDEVIICDYKGKEVVDIDNKPVKGIVIGKTNDTSYVERDDGLVGCWVKNSLLKKVM